MDADHRSAAPEPTPNLLPSLMTEVRRRRRRTRMITWTTGAAAAVLLSVALFVGLSGHHPASSPPQATVSALQMDQVGTTALASTVSLSSQHWGTYIDLNCVCLAPVTAHHDKLAMVVVSRDGTHTQLATWVAEPGPHGEARWQHIDTGRPDRPGAGGFRRQRERTAAALALN